MAGRTRAAALGAWRRRGWLWWLVAVPGLTLFFWLEGASDLPALAGRWARTWPWLVVGWWLFVPLPSLMSGRRHHPSGRQALCLLAVVFAGVLLTGVTHLVPMPALFGLGFGEHLDLYDLIGEYRPFSESRAWPLESRRPVVVENPYGSVRVRVSADDRLRLEVLGSIRRTGPMDVAPPAFGLEERSGGYLVTPRYEQPEGAGSRRGFRARLDVAVPGGHDVTVTNRGGGVEVVGSPGGFRIVAADSGVLLRRPGDRVDVVVRRGDVRVALPADAAVRISGEIVGGAFLSDFPALGARADGAELELRGVSDGVGPLVPISFDVVEGIVRITTSGWGID